MKKDVMEKGLQKDKKKFHSELMFLCLLMLTFYSTKINVIERYLHDDLEIKLLSTSSALIDVQIVKVV